MISSHSPGRSPPRPMLCLISVLRVLAFDVLEFLVDDEVLLAVHLRDLHLNDVGGLLDDVAERDRHLDVGSHGDGNARAITSTAAVAANTSHSDAPRHQCSHCKSGPRWTEYCFFVLFPYSPPSAPFPP